MPVSALSLSKKIEERYDYVQTLYPKDPAVRLLQQQVLTEMHAPKEATQIMTTLHRLQRFELAGKLEMLDNQAIATALYDPRFISWNKYAGLPVAKERKVHLGELLYSAGKITQTSTLLQGFDYARDVAESVLDQCIQNGHDVDVWIEDRPFQNRLLNHADEKIARACGEYWAGRYEGFE
ncbi:MAG: hypothetical protein JWM96_6, partial [Alphaproteobacteria bacterium]|nr:hypothetical protein [Alphaproteobacteria bacterium]